MFPASYGHKYCITICLYNVPRILSSCVMRTMFVDSSIRSFQTVQLAHEQYQTIDNTTKTPIVILHGLLGSKRNWQSFAKALSRSGRKVVTVDARNHGDSPHIEDMTYEAMSQDVVRLLDKLQMRRANILGHSMGGKIAMTLALMKPELVDKLIIEDIAPSERSHSKLAYPKYLEAMKLVRFDHGLNSVMVQKMVGQQLREVIPDRTIRNFILTNIKQNEEQKYTWKVNIDSLLNHISDISDFPAYTTSFQGNTLFVAGSKSDYIRNEHIPLIKELFPNADIVYIEKAGHWVHFDKPGDFLQTVLKFLDET